MGRVINPDSAGKERTRLTKATVLALRALMRQTQPDDTSRDLASFISIALIQISETIDVSVEAWEKRGYWLKADRFRREWEWAKQAGKQMQDAVLQENWAEIARISAFVGGKLMKVVVSDKHRLGTPWVGAYQLLRKSSQ
ncbi:MULTISPECIES: hypothetical protein [Anaerolinea]|uniref:hypothetical protein n=1 Tax=Anaerolinea TaxID=233189 RepID=UPI00261BBF06|nr:hypothetical protein [Anaerolinea thermophila]